MIDYYLSGVVLRSTQVIVDSAIWIAVGCFIASVFRTMLGPEKTRALFGTGTPFGLVLGWLFGMLLPVCSLGVIPIVREMHRSGVKGGTIVSFGLTAPLFNPMSFLYGLTMADPVAILVFTFAAFIIVSLLGLLWDIWFPQPIDAREDAFEAAFGLRRSIALIHNTCRSLISPTIAFILIGVICSVMLTVSVPKGAMQAEAEPDKIYAPALMAFFMTPIYATPVQAMGQIGSMVQHGNSIGAAFSLLILGAGTNLGLLLWFVVAFGYKRALTFTLFLILVTVALAYCLDKPLYPKGVHPTGHTHAFDIYTHPYESTSEGRLEKAYDDAAEFKKENDHGGVVLLLFLVFCGVCFLPLERFIDLNAWYAQTRPKRSRFDRVIPGWVLGLTTVIGLVFASIGGAYLYYPPPKQLMPDLFAIHTECVIAAKTKDWEGVRKWVPICDDLSRRLEVGIFLREGKVSEFCSANAENYRETLDEMRDAMEERHYGEIQGLASEVSAAYTRLSNSVNK